MEHFNGLTPAEDERLAWLSEECGELIQAIGKIQRHGYESHNPNDPNHQGNRADLQMECGDVFAAIALLYRNNDIDYDGMMRRRSDKLDTVNLYLHHNRTTVAS
jgi:NTP pyrophosphatase (non-canonical NTP hydrolase)